MNPTRRFTKFTLKLLGILTVAANTNMSNFTAALVQPTRGTDFSLCPILPAGCLGRGLYLQPAKENARRGAAPCGSQGAAVGVPSVLPCFPSILLTDR